MTPEEINIKSLELAVEYCLNTFAPESLTQQGVKGTLWLAGKYREFITDTSWADEKKLAVAEDNITNKILKVLHTIDEMLGGGCGYDDVVLLKHALLDIIEEEGGKK